MSKKIIIYQLLPRLFGNTAEGCIPDGTIEQNGCGKLADISEIALASIKELGITHVWLTGVIRHATQTSYSEFGLPPDPPEIVKGKAGSPYAIKDYYDIDPDLSLVVPDRMQEFERLIQRLHNADLHVILDFVPNHVSRTYLSVNLPPEVVNLGQNDNPEVHFSPLNNFYYFPGQSFSIQGLTDGRTNSYQEIPAKATGNDVFRPDPDQNDWYETIKLNYGVDYRSGKCYFSPVPDTWIKMTEILLFWSSKGIDGFRCDMAGMVPVEFWRYAISQVKSDFPKTLFIAEIYEPQRYRSYLHHGLFDYLYDKVGLYDTLIAVIRKEKSTREISWVWQNLDGLDNEMLRFIENHDEVRIASAEGSGDPANGLQAMVIAALMNRGPVMLYSGQEVGEPVVGVAGFSGNDSRTSIFDYTVIPEFQKWYNRGRCDGALLSGFQSELRNAYANLLSLSGKIPEFANGYFYDLMYANEDQPHRENIFAFLRYIGSQPDEAILVATCFNLPAKSLRIRIPEHAFLSMGFGSKEYINLSPIEPSTTAPSTWLYSQIINIGILLPINSYGYGVFRIQ